MEFTNVVDGKFLAVGSLEPKFWAAFVAELGLPDLLTEAMEMGEQGEQIRHLIEQELSKHTRDEWAERFSKIDACVEPILLPSRSFCTSSDARTSECRVSSTSHGRLRSSPFVLHFGSLLISFPNILQLHNSVSIEKKS